jgi:hypothetical protein
MPDPFPFEDRFYEVQPIQSPYVMRGVSRVETEVPQCGLTWLTALSRLGFLLFMGLLFKRLLGWFRSP